MSDTLRTVQRTLAQAMALLGPMERPTPDQLEEVHALLFDAAQLLDPLVPVTTVYLTYDPAGPVVCAYDTPGHFQMANASVWSGGSVAEAIGQYEGVRRVWMDDYAGLPDDELVFGVDA